MVAISALLSRARQANRLETPREFGVHADSSGLGALRPEGHNAGSEPLNGAMHDQFSEMTHILARQKSGEPVMAGSKGANFIIAGTVNGFEQVTAVAGSSYPGVFSELVSRVEQSQVPVSGTFAGTVFEVRAGEDLVSVTTRFETARRAAYQHQKLSAAAVRKRDLETFISRGGVITEVPPTSMKLEPAAHRGAQYGMLKPSQIGDLPRGTQLTDVTSGEKVIVGFDAEKMNAHLSSGRAGVSNYGFPAAAASANVSEAAAPRSLSTIIESATSRATRTRGPIDFLETPTGLSVKELTNPTEIEAFTPHLLETISKDIAQTQRGESIPSAADYAAAKRNVAYLVGKGYVAPLTKSVWQSAIAAFSTGSGSQLAAVKATLDPIMDH